jgi:hypothetical protein
MCPPVVVAVGAGHVGITSFGGCRRLVKTGCRSPSHGRQRASTIVSPVRRALTRKEVHPPPQRECGFAATGGRAAGAASSGTRCSELHRLGRRLDRESGAPMRARTGRRAAASPAALKRASRLPGSPEADAGGGLILPRERSRTAGLASVPRKASQAFWNAGVEPAPYDYKSYALPD